MRKLIECFTSRSGHNILVILPILDRILGMILIRLGRILSGLIKVQGLQTHYIDMHLLSGQSLLKHPTIGYFAYSELPPRKNQVLIMILVLVILLFCDLQLKKVDNIQMIFGVYELQGRQILVIHICQLGLQTLHHNEPNHHYHVCYMPSIHSSLKTQETGATTLSHQLSTKY